MSKTEPRIQRGLSDREHPYFMLPKSLTMDKRFTADSFGVLVYLLGMPDDWIVRPTQLMKHFNIGSNKAYKIINQLIELGYMKREAMRGDDGRITEWVYYVWAEPLGIEQPLDGFPQVDNPQVENPLVENHHPTKYKDILSNKKELRKPPDLRVEDDDKSTPTSVKPPSGSVNLFAEITIGDTTPDDSKDFETNEFEKVLFTHVRNAGKWITPAMRSNLNKKVIVPTESGVVEMESPQWYWDNEPMFKQFIAGIVAKSREFKQSRSDIIATVCNYSRKDTGWHAFYNQYDLGNSQKDVGSDFFDVNNSWID